MLQQIREKSKGVFGWVILGAIILVLTLFGFGAFTAFVSAEPTVAKVGGTEITRDEFERAIDRQRRQLIAQLGPDTDPELLEDDALAGRVLASLVERTLLLEGARNAGFVVPEARLDRMIVGMDEFRTGGRFDPERFRVVLGSAGMTPAGFRRSLADDLLIEQLAAGLGQSTFTTDSELRQLAELLRQQRDTAWLRFGPDRFAEQVEVTDAALREFYEAESGRYFAPEQVRVRYVVLEQDALLEQVEVSEAAIRGAWERELEDHEGQERRGAAHILIATGSARSEEEALARAEEIVARLEGGEDFAELAREYSDDPGSAEAGGDLGMAGRGMFAPPFERALFAMEEPGEISEPVVSEFGVHIIRLGEITRADPPTFEGRRAALLQRLREERLRETFVEVREELDTLAFESIDLEEPAEALGLEIRSAGPFGRDGGDGLFSHRELIRAAFSGEVLEEGYNSSVIEVEEGVAVVLRLDAYEPARQRPLEEVAEQVRADYIASESRRLAREASAAADRRLEEGASTGSVAGRYGLAWQRRDGMERNAPDVPRQVRDTAFRLPHPADGGRSVGRVGLPDGSQALVVVTGVRPGDPLALTSNEREQLRGVLRATIENQEFEAYRAALRRDLGVDIRRPEL